MEGKVFCKESKKLARAIVSVLNTEVLEFW